MPYWGVAGLSKKICPAEGVAQDGNAGWSEGKTFSSCIIYFPVLRNCWVKTWAGIALSISIVPT
ncbi:MAG: hypothetical protein II631_03145, partial [Treponema sp.]|nr:hypothetical protein [Treponema sp.]